MEERSASGESMGERGEVAAGEGERDAATGREGEDEYGGEGRNARHDFYLA